MSRVPCVTRACPFCGAQNPVPHVTVYDWAYSGEGPFFYMRCSHCGGVYLTPAPLPELLARFYPPAYAPHRGALKAKGPRAWLARYGLERRCAIVARLVPAGGRVLDVGCGSGQFGQALAERGYVVEGLEPNVAAAEVARQHGIKVYACVVEAADFPARYDVITLWDVVEHFWAPSDALRRIADWLRPGGWLVLRTPNLRSVYARCWRAYWGGYDAPRHLQVYDWPHLAGLLEQAGLKPQRLSGLAGSYAQGVLSLERWLRARGYGPGALKIARHPLAQLLLAGPCKLGDLVGGGAELLATGRRLR